MSYTLDDAWQNALVLIGLPEDDGYLAPQAVKRTIVSKAQRDVASRLDWPELAVETTLTVSGAPPFDIGSNDENFLRLQWVAVEPSSGTAPTQLLLPRQRRDLVALDRDSATAVPRYYTVVSDGLGKLQLWISPAPRLDTVIRYSYVRKPADVLNDTDPLLIPDHLIEAVELRIAYRMAVRKGDLERAGFLRGEYDSAMRDLQDETITSRGPILPRTRQDW